MKVELQCGDTIAIPEGCKAIVKDGSVEFEKEEKEEVREFKEGDVLHSVYADITLIFEKYSTYYSFTSHYSTLNAAGFDWAVKSFRHATKEEKSEFFDKMKEQGLRWNTEEKRVEKRRWRAKSGKCYFSFSGTTFNLCCYTECFAKDDINLYNCGNYFRTQEQVTEAAKRVREALRQYHEEIGE